MLRPNKKNFVATLGIWSRLAISLEGLVYHRDKLVNEFNTKGVNCVIIGTTASAVEGALFDLFETEIENRTKEPLKGDEGELLFNALKSILAECQKSFVGKVKSYKKYLGIELTQLKGYVDIKILFGLRKAIHHGSPMRYENLIEEGAIVSESWSHDVTRLRELGFVDKANKYNYSNDGRPNNLF